MYKARIIKKDITEQYDFIFLTVQLRGEPIIINSKKQFILDDDGTPKLTKDGKPKEVKLEKEKIPTKEILFKFPIETTFAEIKATIRKRIDAIEEAESLPIETDVDLDFTVVKNVI